MGCTVGAWKAFEFSPASASVCSSGMEWGKQCGETHLFFVFSLPHQLRLFAFPRRMGFKMWAGFFLPIQSCLSVVFWSGANAMESWRELFQVLTFCWGVSSR